MANVNPVPPPPDQSSAEPRGDRDQDASATGNEQGRKRSKLPHWRPVRWLRDRSLLGKFFIGLVAAGIAVGAGTNVSEAIKKLKTDKSPYAGLTNLDSGGRPVNRDNEFIGPPPELPLPLEATQLPSDDLQSLGPLGGSEDIASSPPRAEGPEVIPRTPYNGPFGSERKDAAAASTTVTYDIEL